MTPVAKRDALFLSMTIEDADQLVQAWAALEEAKTDPARVPTALTLAADLIGSIAVNVGQP